jgi:hypothetical protein
MHALLSSWRILLVRHLMVPVLALASLLAGDLRIAPAAEPAAPPRYKTGDFVVVVRRTELKVESEVVDVVDEGLLLGVDRVAGDWLWVTSKKSGWIHRRSVVPARQAVELLGTAIRRAPHDARLYARRGLARALNLDFPAALKDYNEALRLKPEEAVYYGDRGCIWLALGDADRAIADFNEEKSRLDSEDEANRGIRRDWLDQRLADARAIQSGDTKPTANEAP